MVRRPSVGRGFGKRRHRRLGTRRDEAAGEIDGHVAAVVGKRLAGMPSEIGYMQQVSARLPSPRIPESIVTRMAMGSKL